MRPDTIQTYVRAVPFMPFRIAMTGGKSYEVRHPEAIAVGRDVFIYYHRPQPDQPFERREPVSLLLIQNIEHLERPAAKEGAA